MKSGGIHTFLIPMAVVAAVGMVWLQANRPAAGPKTVLASTFIANPSPIKTPDGRTSMWNWLQTNATPDKPRWESWKTKCDLKLIDGGSCQNATVWFDDGASSWAWNLNSSDSLYSLLKSDSTAPAVVPLPQQHGTTIVKEIWEFIGRDDTSKKWQFVLYDPSMFPSPRDKPNLGEISNWNPPSTQLPTLKSAAGGLGAPDGLDLAAPCPKGPGNLEKPDNVPLNCFVNRTFKKCAAAGDTFLGSPSLNIGFNSPCVAILVGFDVMQWNSNGGNWRWGTFWLTANPSALTGVTGSKFASGRPDNLPPQYQNYALIEEDGQPAIADSLKQTSPIYNPYFEGSLDKFGITTNCQQCHAGAVYIPSSDRSPFRGTGKVFEHRRRDPMCEGAKLNQPAQNYCQLHTGWSWSLADAQDPDNRAQIKAQQLSAIREQ